MMSEQSSGAQRSLRQQFPFLNIQSTPALVALLIIGLLLFALLAANGDLGSFGLTVTSGLFRAMLLFLVASGLSIIFGLMDVLNFAQGSLFMIGAYITLDYVHPNLPVGLSPLANSFPTESLLFLICIGVVVYFTLRSLETLRNLSPVYGERWLQVLFVVTLLVAMIYGDGVVGSIVDPNLRVLIALLSAALVGAALGVVLERGLLRPLYARPIFQLVLTFGVAIVFGELARAIWGTAAQTWLQPFALFNSSVNDTSTYFVLFGQRFSIYRLFIIFVGFLLMVLVILLLRRTRTGIVIRAGVEDSAMVEALGINVRLVFTLVFTLGCAVAALGGGVAAPFLGVNLGLGNAFLLQAIAVVVLGGLGSYEGTAVGSILVGLAVAVVTDFTAQASINQPVWGSITPMLLLILVLLLRPSGLFGKE